jgi:endonuclease G
MNLLPIKKVLLTLVLSVLYTATTLAKVEVVIGNTAPEKNLNLAFTLPDTDISEILISRDQYLISYNKSRRAPNWVSWKIDQNSLGKISRSNKFQQDAELEKYLNSTGEGFHAVKATDFQKSCFDRGHQIPSGDRTDSQINNEATFVMSNMTAQTPYLNQVVWEHLEAYTRTLVLKENKKVYVMAGPIYDENFGAIGPAHDIPVPSKSFKIILILNKDQGPTDINKNTPMITVIMPNTLKDGQIPVPGVPNCGAKVTDLTGGADDWKQFQTTLSEIESKSGLKFHEFAVE